MMFKKRHVLLLCTAITLLALVSCGGDSTPSATKTPIPTLTPTPTWASGEEIAYLGINRIIFHDLKTNQTHPFSGGTEWAIIGGLTWSPDGSQMAFECQEGTSVNIYILDIAEGSVRPVTHGEGAESAFTGATWSPDGKQIAMIKGTFGADIFILDLTSGEMEQITDTESSEWGVSWSPDGTRLAFNGIGENNGIYTINIDGTDQRQIVGAEVHYPRDPKWSPDASQLAFSGNPGGKEDIFIVNADGTGLRALVEDGKVNSQPSWSPDGSQLVYKSIGEGSRIVVVDVDSGVTHVLNDDRNIKTYPVWKP